MVKKTHVSCFKIYFNLKKFSTFWYTAIFFSGDLGKQTVYLCTIKAWLWVRNIRNTKNAFIFLCQVESTSFCRLSMHIQIYQVCIWLPWINGPVIIHIKYCVFSSFECLDFMIFSIHFVDNPKVESRDQF